MLYLFYSSKLQLFSTILMANVARLARFVIFYSRHLFSTIYVFLCILSLYISFMNGLPLWDIVSMNLATINMMYPPKEIVL